MTSADDAVRVLGYSSILEALADLAAVKHLAVLSSQAVKEPMEALRGIRRMQNTRPLPQWAEPLLEATTFVAGANLDSLQERPSDVFPEALPVGQRGGAAHIWVSLKQLASELKMDRSACRRWVLSQGIEPVRRRMPDSHFQVALAVRRDVADRLIATRKEEGYL